MVAVARQMADRPVAVRVHDLHKRFGTLEVLKGVSLTAREVDVVSMIGASGSGKSTLGRAIAGLGPMASGVISWQGEALPPRQRRSAEHRRRRPLTTSAGFGPAKMALTVTAAASSAPPLTIAAAAMVLRTPLRRRGRARRTIFETLRAAS